MSEVAHRNTPEYKNYKLESDYQQELSKTALSNLDLEQIARNKIETHLKENGRLLSAFAKDSSLKFEPSATATTFAFYPGENKVELPLSWFENEEYTDSEMRWAQYHELSHFTDMRKNPQAYLDNFDKMRQTADQLTSEYASKFPDHNPQSIQGYFYKQVHTLYNCLDDIYVNNLVGIKAPYYHSGDGKYDVTNIYRKIGYAEPDLSEAPPHTQLAFSLLRDEMVGDQLGKSQISDEVEAVLSKKVLGRGIRDIINQELKPKANYLVDPEYRYKLIRTFIEPAYIKLLKEALDQKITNSENLSGNKQSGQQSESGQQSGEQSENPSDQQSESDQQSGQQSGEQSESDQQSNEQSKGSNGEQSDKSSNQQTADFDPFGQKNENSHNQNFLDSADEETTKQILDSFKEQDRVDNLSPEERQAYLDQRKKADFDKKHKITRENRKEYENILGQISQARREMREFWKELIGKSIEYRSTIQHKQRRGNLNIRETVNQFPELIEAQRSGKLNENDIYDRHQLEKTILERPESIEISLMIDTSGSMCSSEKLNAAKQTAVLLMRSIKDFNTYLDQTRRETGSKLRANTQVITYSDDFEEAKPFEKTVNFSDNEANIIKTITKIIPYGGTNDTAPLLSISESLSSEQLSKIRAQKLQKIVFVITDGASDDPKVTQQVVSDLTKKGVLAFGFQIGDVDDDEKSIFDYVWNRNQKTKMGIFIGNNLNSLPKELFKALTNSMKGIRL